MRWKMRVIYSNTHAQSSGNTNIELILVDRPSVTVEQQFIRFEYLWQGMVFVRLVHQSNIGGVEIEQIPEERLVH